MADDNDADAGAGLATFQMTTLVKAEGGDAIISNSFKSDDEFAHYYIGAKAEKGIIEPPYNFKQLDRLSQENNALGPCVEAMVTNIDGTGFQFASVDKEEEDNADDQNIKKLNDFFSQPWPGESFTTQRKNVRRDLERVGNGYLEVIRNNAGEIVFFKHADAKVTRLVRYDEAVFVERTVMRDGKAVTMKVQDRERRFVQMVNNKVIYFKEFGSQRDLDKYTGLWAPKGVQLSAQIRASEMIHFTTLPDASTPYGVPRWINQLPSVLGSRKAEILNNDFFDEGGVPPVMILLQGGSLADTTRKAFEQKTGGLAMKKNRVQVIEVAPTGGTIDKPGVAAVRVERFGSEKQSDSMFEGYDERCEVRVRRSFRLPPIFVGQAADYSFATAFASYTVAEAQVFKPERDEFDEIMSIKVLPAMGFAGYKMKSLPLNIKDAVLVMQGIEKAAATKRVSPEDIINEINTTVGTNFKVTDEEQLNFTERNSILSIEEQAAQIAQGQKPDPNAVTNAPKPNGTPRENPRTPLAKSEGVLALAADMMMALRKRDFNAIAANVELVNTLPEYEQKAFRQALATFQFIDPSIDPEGLAEIAGCTLAVMAANHDGHGHKH